MPCGPSLAASQERAHPHLHYRVEGQPWYVGKLPRKLVEETLLKKGSNGDFVVRESEQKAGGFTLVCTSCVLISCPPAPCRTLPRPRAQPGHRMYRPMTMHAVRTTHRRALGRFAGGTPSAMTASCRAQTGNGTSKAKSTTLSLKRSLSCWSACASWPNGPWGIC